MAWDVYYQIFVARFLESFPHREVVEVKRKIQSMLTKRQLKVQGEEEYWSELRKNSAHVKSKGNPAALYHMHFDQKHTLSHPFHALSYHCSR